MNLTSTRSVSTAPLRLTVISASIRDDRIGHRVADWAAARVRSAGADATLVDLAEVDLPDDRLLRPGGGPRSDIADVIEASDGYVVVTPEYNHSYPASLKRAIDWHHSEWMFKAVAVVSYGARGGLLATEQLRGVFAELHVVTTRNGVGLTAPWNDLDADAYRAPYGVEDALDGAIAELAWWSETLRDARTRRPFGA